LAIICLAGTSLLAQVQLSADRNHLTVGDSLALTATWSGAGPMPPLEWSLAPDAPGLLTPGEAGRATYTLPFLLKAQMVTVQVRAAAAGLPGTPVPQASIRLRAEHSASDMEKILESLVSGYLGRSQIMESRMELLAGSHSQHPGQGSLVMGKGTQARFGSIAHLAYAGDHPSPAIRGKWLVLEDKVGHVAVLGQDGQCTAWVGAQEPKGATPFAGGGFGLTDATNPCDGPAAEARFSNPSAIAVRPGGQGDTWQAAIADTNHFRIGLLDAKGNVTTLAGRSRDLLSDEPIVDGPVEMATFSRPTGVAYGLDGALYVADHTTLRRIHQGAVTTLAGRPPGSFTEERIQDGTGADASFADLTSLALDPRTGDLLVTDSESVRRVTPEGVVTTLAGGEQKGFEDWQKQAPEAGRVDAMKGVPCLSHPWGLLVAGGKAYIADHWNSAVRILDLDTGMLKTLVGVGKQEAFKPGRLPAGKDLPEGQRAQILYPTAMAMDPEGRMVLALTAPGHRGALVADLVLDPEDMPRLETGSTQQDRGHGLTATGGVERKDSVVEGVRLAKDGPAGAIAAGEDPGALCQRIGSPAQMPAAPPSQPSAGAGPAGAGTRRKASAAPEGEPKAKRACTKDGPAGAAPLPALDDDLEMTPAETLLTTAMDEVD
jgi:hypothetical protein